MKRKTGRRDFILSLITVCVLAIPAVSFILFNPKGKRKVTFTEAELDKVAYKDEVFVVNLKGRIMAFSAHCTHLGCIVNFNRKKNIFECPCHGSKYAIDGKRICGPTKRGLDKLPFVKKNGKITVEIA
ncbi:MAG: ubiquinol-cytochrome c reductase iron-sulfur subunit [Deltaproteobacteria bacterium]|nr:ubiquinol-cytochrome c reductase iron-sulfur subunit [Deltaproteobacteria bacterium]